MYAAITHVDKQSFPFIDVLRVYFSEVAIHAKINVPIPLGHVNVKARSVDARFDMLISVFVAVWWCVIICSLCRSLLLRSVLAS